MRKSHLSTKYYVCSGELRTIVIAKTPKVAAKLAVLKADGEELGDVFYVDERGFRDNNKKDTLVPNWVFPYGDIVSK